MTAAPQQVGYYGKLPARGDFVGRRLSPDTVAAWDDWLQGAIHASQEALGAQWKERYYVTPLWRFVIPAGLSGPTVLAGVMMPSVDKVGRCYPLMIGQTAEAGINISTLSEQNGVWFERAEELALACLAEDFDLAGLDQPLPALDTVAGPATGETTAFNDGEAGIWFSLTGLFTMSQHCTALGAGCSLWWSTGSLDFPAVGVIADRLPRAEAFTAFITGEWTKYGWRGVEDAPAGAPDLLEPIPAAVAPDLLDLLEPVPAVAAPDLLDMLDPEIPDDLLESVPHQTPPEHDLLDAAPAAAPEPAALDWDREA